ncbi:hypothetical protein O181_010472 [Austropuccinia psidii MF-1]|uniref:Uncharacterized protein n=1 Tax=Austropuccinia psidii MF-1 TaxID=1389203 RepID=A0A9Q3GL84_9BASI|nr:hypothetical protein [Austropuccinia psidii MF-1]
MSSLTSNFFNNNAAAMIYHWIEKNFPVTEFPDSPPALQSTTPLHTPAVWHVSSYFPSLPALESTTLFDTLSDWHGLSYFPSPPALDKIDGDEFSSQYISQESPPSLEPLNDNNSLENFGNNSSPALFCEESVSMISLDNSSSLNSLPNSPIAFESSSLSSTFNSALDSSSPHFQIESPTLF